MADRPPLSPRPAVSRPARRSHQAPTTDHHHPASSTHHQLLGFLALAVVLTALLVLAGVTLTAALAAVVVLSPLALLTLPLWAPVAVVVFLTGAASLLACSAGVAAAAAGTWAYRWFTGRRRSVEDAGHVGYSRQGAVADVADRVRGYYDAYARQYGAVPRPHGGRVKDAAPGA
ncbi:hypothetical protein QOZ80_1AG0026180 [Eleusine coracana subsp. coracana]|nr:hypothetical protein QOZ80_1AG0026180 [Eleusine coracana subsp. coracana]